MKCFPKSFEEKKKIVTKNFHTIARFQSHAKVTEILY